MARKPYQQRTDIEKIHSQWHKLSGLHTREEWSAAVVRAATAAEIAANLAIRAEFSEQSKLSSKFIDSQLKWANGLSGKIDHLMAPLWQYQPAKRKGLNSLRRLAKAITLRRNAIVHLGEFCNAIEATDIIEKAENFIIDLVRIYHSNFVLLDKGADSQERS